MARVIEREPDWDALPASTPRALERLLRRCLVKKRQDRLRDIGDARLEIEEAISRPVDHQAAGAVPSRPSWKVPAAVGVGVIGLVFGVVTWLSQPRPTGPMWLSIQLPESFALRLSGNGRDLDVTSDGATLVYRGERGLLVHQVGSRTATELTGATGGWEPTVSPDNQWVAFVSYDESLPTLKRIPLAGGPPTTVATMTSDLGIRGITWIGDDTFVFGRDRGPLERVRLGDDRSETLTTTGRSGDGAYEVAHRWPTFVPGANVLLFAAFDGGGARLKARRLDTDDEVALDIEGTNPRYLSSGQLLYVTPDGSLLAVPFDIDSLTITGTPISLLEETGLKNFGGANIAVSDNGRLFYVPLASRGEPQRSLVWVDRQGRETPVDAANLPDASYQFPRLSPDESRLAIGLGTTEGTVYGAGINIYTFENGLVSEFMAPGTVSAHPTWSADGGEIMFNSTLGGARTLYRKGIDSSEDPVPLTESHGCEQWPQALTPDGASVVYRENCPRSFRTAPVNGGDEEDGILLQRDGILVNAEPSPDGNWLAYAYASSNDSPMSVFVAPYADPTRGVQVSGPDGRMPLWSSTGRELFFVENNWSSESRLMSVSIGAGPNFTSGRPMELLDASAYHFGQFGRNYDVSSDGQRFLMVKRPPPAPEASEGRTGHIGVVLNFVEELAVLTAVR